MKKLAALLCLLLFLPFCHRESPAPPAAPAPPPIRIGLVTGLTGPTAAWGEAIRRGAEMAIEDARAGGQRVELVIDDDQGRPEQTANAAERQIVSKNVIALVAADTSGGSLAASPVAEREGVAMVSPTASAPAVTQGKRSMFRVCATDDLEAAGAARLVRERLGATRVAIIRDTRNDYSVGMASVFSTELLRLEGTITGMYDYASGDSDFRPQLTAAAGTKPDVLFIPGYYSDVAPIAIQARDLGITLPLVGGSGWDSPKLIEVGGGAVEGAWYVSGLRSASPRFVSEFRKRYGAAPDGANAQAYDAVALICNAITRSGPRATRAQVLDAIATTRNFPGASGTITIGPDHNARKPLAVFHVEQGAPVEKGTVKP